MHIPEGNDDNNVDGQPENRDAGDVSETEADAPVIIPPAAGLPSFEASAGKAGVAVKKAPKPKTQVRKPRNSIIPMPMADGKPAHVSPLVNRGGSIIVSDFVKEVLPPTEQNDMLAQAMNQVLNVLRFRLPHLLRARDLLLNQVRQNGAKRMMEMYTSSYVNVPRKTDMHAFTALAINKFLREQLPREDLDFGLAVTIPPRFVVDFESKIFHFVTTVSFNRLNTIGGKSIMENPKKMLFIDVSSPNKHFEDSLVVDKVSNMQNYGLRPYNHKKEHHRQNVYARRAFEKVHNWGNKDLDQYSQFLFEALTAPEKLVPFEYNPDLLGEALHSSVDHGNSITDEVRKSVLLVLGVPELLADAVVKSESGHIKIASDIRRELLQLLAGKGGEPGEADDAEKSGDAGDVAFDRNKIETLVVLMKLPKKYLK